MCLHWGELCTSGQQRSTWRLEHSADGRWLLVRVGQGECSGCVTANVVSRLDKAIDRGRESIYAREHEHSLNTAGVSGNGLLRWFWVPVGWNGVVMRRSEVSPHKTNPLFRPSFSQRVTFRKSRT